MNRFLLLALTAGLFSPIAANAASAWLILRYGNIYGSRGAVALEKVKMSNMNQCELMGAKWMGTKLSQRENNFEKSMVFGYECIEGE